MSAAFAAFDPVLEPRHLDVIRVLGNIDARLMPAGVIEAGGDKAMHAEAAHVAERHRFAGRMLGDHSTTSAAIA